ncbi:S-layer homology domain-containing protein [Lysinibacillus fusiformis]|uniref:S-layer homology domain-containing protein n=1 Tax=Lysinibacillus fusiformis TaxID=28031 RepID=UPI0021C213D4|nr:S-layer homology domain-containing protein [Lysinibacillus fusiformis]UXJ71367.1 S-layer homology domain-containing protein [Lysinibacillus fusiformis]
MEENNKKRKTSLSKSNIKKAINLMLVAGVAAPGLVGGISVQNAEAATIYTWNKYSMSNGETVWKERVFSVSEAADANYFATQVNGSLKYEGMNIIVSYQETVSGSKTYVGQVTSSNSNQYPNNGFGEGGYYYEYVGSVNVNNPPINVTVQAPEGPYEHGEKKLIYVNAQDNDGDQLYFTLQASYDGGANWAGFNLGTNKVYEYTVPSDKTQVQFRVIASDGNESRTSAISTVKTIREVQYYWNKFEVKVNRTESFTTYNSYGPLLDGAYADSNPYTGWGWLIREANDPTLALKKQGSSVYLIRVIENEERGDLIKNDIQGGFNAYQHGMKNPDGYWYERGQVVLSEDTTPPIIVWNEQKEFASTSTINVKAHDLSGIKLLKFAKGEQGSTYFATGGTTIAGESFSVNENGKYTLYAEDSKGNKTVETIDVTKVNQKPVVSKKIEPISIHGKGKEIEIDLTKHFIDPDGHPITFTVVSSSEAHVKATIENGSQLKVTGVEKGESKLTISANDGYETTTVQLDVTVSNTKPILTVEKLPNHIVLDEQSHFMIKGTAVDEDKDTLTAKVKHLNKEVTAPVNAGYFSVKYQGNQVSKGYHHEAMQVTVSDGLEDSDIYTATVPMIKVKDATNYVKDMDDHQVTYNTWTPDQHEAFYNGYESIFNYENIRTEDALTKAKDAIAALQVLTVAESETITNWENRLDVVTAAVATENAEKSLIKEEHKHAKELVEALTPSAEKDALEERINELRRFHDANDAITSMEEDHNRISWDAIEDAQEKVAVVENLTNQQNLYNRLTQIIKDYLSELQTVTPEDLDKFGVKDVNPDNSDFYDEYKDVFHPLGENTNAQDLVDFVNALKIALRDVTTSAVNTLHNKVPAYAEAALTPVLTTVDELLSYRQTFKREASRDKALANHVQSVLFHHTNTYMQTIVTAMQEVIEYNDTHDDGEKSEAHTATFALWDGQLLTDMQAYLNNGIPDILVVDDRYEYINNGQLKVRATIHDSNDTEHDVTVTFNGETKTVKTNDGQVAVTFDVADGAYNGYVEISAKDKLTERLLTIASKPVVTVSDVEMFKRFVQALESDKSTNFDGMDHSTITSLKTLFDKTLAVKVNVSSEREIREIENSATKLGGKNGQLESLVKLLVQNNRLEWLINNYEIATDDDFTWAGVVGVTAENIGALKSIIDDYVASFEGGPVQTPTVEDYQTWLNLSEVIEEARRAITAAEGLHTQGELREAIATAEEKLDKVPTWLTAKQALRTQLDAVIAYFNVIDSVVQAETSYQQADKDSAQQLVDQLTAGTPKDNLLALLARLAAVQTVIDATVGVEQAEASLEDADRVAAQALVDAIDPANAKQAELQVRLDAISTIHQAIKAVEDAEISKSQTDVDIAKELVQALPDSPKKQELQDRLSALQDVLDNKSKEDQAKDAVSKAEDSLQEEDRTQAQEKVDALEDGALKTELQDRLDALQEYVDAYPAALQAVEQAEQSKATADVETAQPLVEALPSSRAKTALQERLDKVNQFIQAEGAVSKAEVSLIQKHKNEAQVLVDALPASTDKTALQQRLDALQKAIDEKKEDLLDKIINDLDNVTAKELADYTGEDVYEELLREYLEEIGKLGDTVTKEQIIEIIKVINSLEISKREMLLPYIHAYGKEYAAATLPTLHTYPQPRALSSVVDYLTDDDALEQVIQEIATALKVPEAEIRAEIEKILQDVSDDVTTGKYLVQYVTTEGEVITENWVMGVPYGEVIVEGLVPEGYELVGETNQLFVLSDETVGQSVSFTIQAKEVHEPTKEDEETEQPNNGIDDPAAEETTAEEGASVVPETSEESFSGTESTEETIAVATLTAELLRSFSSETVNLTTDEEGILVNYVQHLQDYAVEQGWTSYTSEDFNKVLEAIHVAYEQGPTAASKIATLQDGSVKNALMALLQPKTTIGPEASLVRSKMMVASLNDQYLQVSSTPYGNENHAAYVFKTFYALASVKSYKATPTEEYREEVKDYIAKELHDGSYKVLLLKELGYRIDEIGTNDDGIPDLTVVKPTVPPVIVPPVVKPPVEPPVVEPPSVVDPPSVGNPHPTPEPPVVKPEPELPGGTVAETVDYDEKGKWTIKNPAKDVVTLEQNGVQIKLPLELQAKLWEVEWIPKANQHYQLRIWADGKEIMTFKKPIEITKTSKKAYVLRFENGQYKAVPFTFTAPNQLQFKVTKTGEFQFSTKHITFKDIEGVFSQQAIEELASRHIVNGTAPGYYSPHDSVTRAQFSAMLVRGLGLDTAIGEKGIFKDVKASDWYAEDVQSLYATGIIKGVSATKFNPNSLLTRQQAALMLDRVLDYVGVEKESGTLTFTDTAKISVEAQSAVSVMQTMGIFSGRAGNTFDPHAQLTRAEMAKVLQLTLEITALGRSK